MKTSLFCLLGIALIVSSSLPVAAVAGCGQGRGQGGGGGQGGGCDISALPHEELSEAETASLLLMREEEKLARDVYLTLGEKYELNVFTNIPRSEQRHMDRVGDLLAKYDVADPIVDDSRGKFENPELQKLYNDLIDKGSESVIAALQVGATIEDLDIYDLEKAMANDVDNQDIMQIYQNLTKGSRNHMRAFSSQLEAHGGSYEVQFISAADYEAILASDQEHGPAGESQGCGQGQGKGRGKGRGQGRGQGRGCNNG